MITKPAPVSGIYAIYQGSRERYVYVGSSQSIRRRVMGHRCALRQSKHENSYLQRVWNKYGEGDFFFVSPECCGVSALIQREQYWHDALKPLCNLGAFVDSAVRGRKPTEKQMEAALKNFSAGRMLPRTETQKEASVKNMRKAQERSASLPKTENQMEAARKNLEQAHAKPVSPTRTEKQKYASGKNMRKAQAKSASLPRTDKQREAGRKNAQKARAARAARRGKNASN